MSLEQRESDTCILLTALSYHKLGGTISQEWLSSRRKRQSTTIATCCLALQHNYVISTPFNKLVGRRLLCTNMIPTREFSLFLNSQFGFDYIDLTATVDTQSEDHPDNKIELGDWDPSPAPTVGFNH